MERQKKEKIEFDYELLRLRIRARYKSESNFAKAIGVNKSYLSRKLHNQIEITSYEVVTWSRLLDIPESLIGSFFFTPKSTNGKDKANA